MNEPDTLESLHRALVRDSRFAAVERDQLVPLGRDGITHQHVRIAGAEIGGLPALLRIPRLSQWDMEPERQLAYEAACFLRADGSGCTPHFFGTLPVSDELPRGALIVEAITGRKPVLPKELPAVARCLARLHRLPLPPEEERPPLSHHQNAFSATLAVIDQQASFLDQADLEPDARRQIDEEMSALHDMEPNLRRMTPVTAFVGTDTHPGNFLIRPDGKAVFVDLEKVVYGSPAIDLAHATLYTSTTWDPDCAAEIGEGETTAFTAIYLATANQGYSRRLEPWLAPMRRLTWMRTLTWCARWKVLAKRRGGAWDERRLSRRDRTHIRRQVNHYLSPEAIERVRSEWVGD